MSKKKLIASIAFVVALAIPFVAFAAELGTPAEIVAKLSGKTVEEVQDLRNANNTYGQIAKEYGVLDQFEDEMLNLKKSIIDQRVEDGVITQEKGEELKKLFEENKLNCSGTPGENRQQIGKKNGGGLGFGRGIDGKMGNGLGRGQGQGRGFGNGMGNRSGRNAQ